MSTAQHVRRWMIQAGSAAPGSRRANIPRCDLTRPTKAVRSTAPMSQQLFSTSPAHWARTRPKTGSTSLPAPDSQGPKAHTSGTRNAKHNNRQTISELLETRKTPFVAAGLAAMVLGGYLSLLLIGVLHGPKDIDGDEHNCVPTGRPLDMRQGRITALVFDQELNASESRMGITSLRKLMGGLARGHVLEVAVGTGRNIKFVDWDEVRAAAPPIEGQANMMKSKNEVELEQERVTSRLDKGERGLVLPGDEVPEVLSYTGVDVSTEVLEVAWVKLKKAVPELIARRRRTLSEDEVQDSETAAQQDVKSSASKPATKVVSNPQPNTPDQVLAANIGQGRIRLYKGDATQCLPPPPALTSHDSTHILPAPPYYDTILQNFGLCSVGSPHRLLATMAGALRPDSGRIYLLEHGRGSYGWLNSLLDKFAPGHFKKYGCWWNRDIEALVRAAEEEIPGLEVVRIERPGFLQGGTMLWIELKVNATGT